MTQYNKHIDCRLAHLKRSRLIEFYVLTSNQINQRISNGNETIYESKHHAVIKPLQSFDVNEMKIHCLATQMLHTAHTHISRIEDYYSYFILHMQKMNKMKRTNEKPTECDV